MNKEKNKVGRPSSNRRIRVIETGEIANGYSEAARLVKGNRGCVYLCLHNNVNRKKHKGFSFEFVK